MDNLNNPFGVPAPDLPFGQPDPTQKTPVTGNDQQAKVTTFFDDLKAKQDAEKAKQEAEEQAKRELHNKLDRQIRELQRLTWQEKKRALYPYGKWGLISFIGVSILGFRKGGNDNVSGSETRNRRRTDSNDD